jgi:hypothetical protein
VKTEPKLTKKCTQCGLSKNPSCFGVNSKAHDGRKAICKECEAQAEQKRQAGIIGFFVTMGLPAPVTEYKFAESIGREWRFDYAWPECKLALEVDGGSWIGGRHNSPKGSAGDRSKFNYAAALGWRHLHFTPDELLTLSTVQIVKNARCA